MRDTAKGHGEQICTVWNVGVGCQKYQNILWKHSKAERKWQGSRIDICIDCHCGNQDDERNIEKNEMDMTVHTSSCLY